MLWLKLNAIIPVQTVDPLQYIIGLYALGENVDLKFSKKIKVCDLFFHECLNSLNAYINVGMPSDIIDYFVMYSYVIKWLFERLRLFQLQVRFEAAFKYKGCEYWLELLLVNGIHVFCNILKMAIKWWRKSNVISWDYIGSHHVVALTFKFDWESVMLFKKPHFFVFSAKRSFIDDHVWLWEHKRVHFNLKENSFSIICILSWCNRRRLAPRCPQMWNFFGLRKQLNERCVYGLACGRTKVYMCTHAFRFFFFSLNAIHPRFL